jgi:serine/threonine-protein kinase
VRRTLEQLKDTIDAAAAMPGATTIAEQPRVTIEPRRKKSAEIAKALGLLSPSQRGVDVHATIGEGGMGIVRLGTQRALGRDVAVKSIKPEAKSDTATLKLLREAWITGALEHPNVVPVYDIDLGKDGDPHIVLKKIEGAAWVDLMNDPATIARRFHAKDAFGWNLAILQQVATAVHFAHSRGIVHRDLKPENVMIGGHGEVYVVDWGLAVATKDDGTGRFPLASEAIEMAGTPCYMAPEMLGGVHSASPITERTDVYLLGAILHEIATGRPPHEGESLMAILVSVAKSDPSLPDTVPDELARILRRAMDPDPDARFETAEQFRLAITGFLEHRGSIRLAQEAEERLAALEEESKRSDEDRKKDEGDEGKRLRLYHLFGECRFGFLEALRAWRENERARAGLSRAIETMIEFELGAGDPRAASVLLHELPSPSEALKKRVADAVAFANEERARADKLAREHDERIGRRTRAFLGLILGSIWTVGPFVWAWAWTWSDFARSHWAGIDMSIAIGLFGHGLHWWARDSMSKTVINRRLVWTVRITIWAQVALYVGAYMAGIGVEQAHTLLIFMWAVVLAQTSNAIENKLLPATFAAALAFIVACVRPDWVFFCMGLSNAALLTNMVVVWSRLRDDVVDPLQKRAEERRARWAAFLEKTRLEVERSLPPRE